MSDCPEPKPYAWRARSNVSVRTKQHFAPHGHPGPRGAVAAGRAPGRVRATWWSLNPLLDFDYDHGSLVRAARQEDGDLRPMPETAAEGSMRAPAVGDRLGCPRGSTCSPSARRVLSNGKRCTAMCAYSDGVRSAKRTALCSAPLSRTSTTTGTFSGSMHALCAEAGRSIEDGQRLLESCSSCRLATWARAIWPDALRCKSTTAFPMRT